MDEKTEMIDRIQYLITINSKNKSQILRELNLSTSTLSDWGKGKGNPSSSAIIKLAKYFNVTSDYLLFGTEKTENEMLSPTENKWLQIYYMFSESEREDLFGITQHPFNRKDIVIWLNYLTHLSKQEREVCAAFIHGILAAKNLKDS